MDLRALFMELLGMYLQRIETQSSTEAQRFTEGKGGKDNASLALL
jgi:hypothetical protein